MFSDTCQYFGYSCQKLVIACHSAITVGLVQVTRASTRRRKKKKSVISNVRDNGQVFFCLCWKTKEWELPSHSPVPLVFNINEKWNAEVLETLDKKLQNAAQLYDTVLQSYVRDLAQLVSNVWNDKYDGADGGIRVKAESLEPDLFGQSIQMRRLKSWIHWTI